MCNLLENIPEQHLVTTTDPCGNDMVTLAAKVVGRSVEHTCVFLNLLMLLPTLR